MVTRDADEHAGLVDWAMALALWLHALGLIIAVGYYGVLGLVLVPALEKSVHGTDLAEALFGIERRALPLVLASIVLFTVSGLYLLFTDPSYTGIGHVFDNSWSALMLLKHGVIVVLICAGVSVDWFARDLVFAADEAALRKVIRRVRLSAQLAAALGAFAILLTALAQASQ